MFERQGDAVRPNAVCTGAANQRRASAAALVAALGMTAVTTCATAAGVGERHVHGEGELTLVREGSQLTATLHTPTFNLIGYEHAPSTDAERATWAQALARLGRQSPVLEPNRKARCALNQVEFEDPFAVVSEHDEHDEAHAELEISYHFTCTRPQQLKAVAVTLFADFPALTRINAIYLDDKQQVGGTLTTARPTLRW
ncbi:MAG: DUF2796 domain-containing protein [Pseudomonadota bacterium]